MTAWIANIVLIFCFGLLVRQYYSAARRGTSGVVQAARKRDLKHLNSRHLSGAIAMIAGTGCYLMLQTVQIGWLLPRLHEGDTSVTILLMIIALALSCWQGMRDRDSGSGTFSYSQAGAYLLLRTLFLLLYEVFFRVALLGAALLLLPVWAAVALNVILYVGAHLYSPRREAILSIPFGLLLCWLTLAHQSVWPAAMLHLMLSLPYETIVLSYRKKQIHAYAS